MTRTEKMLYHQIHPLKLLTDVTTSFASSWLLWQGHYGRAAAVGLIPSIVISALLVWHWDLEPYKQTPLGRYIRTFMTHKVEALRLAGQALMWGAAATHVPWLFPVGFLVVVFGWLKGLWISTPPDAPLPATPAA